MRYFKDLNHSQRYPQLRAEPTAARLTKSRPGPSGRCGQTRPDRTLASPRPVSRFSPTPVSPSDREPLPEHTLPAPRTPALHFGALKGRRRLRHALRKSQAASADHQRRSLMQSDPVPIRVPARPGNPRRPRRIHHNQLHTRRQHCRSSAAITCRVRKPDKIPAKRFPYSRSHAFFFRNSRSSATTETPSSAARPPTHRAAC